MLFNSNKKKQEFWNQAADGLSRECAEQLEGLRQWLDARFIEADGSTKERSGEFAGQLGQLNTAMAEMQKAQKRQSQTVEDFLDEMQERTEERDSFREHMRKSDEREQRLLSLICCYQEQLNLIQQGILEEHQEDEERASAWRGQFRLLEDEAGQRMRACAMEETGREGERVDFDAHEVLGVIGTEDEMLDNTVAKVYNPGCVYHGRGIKKAQVTVYRRRNDGDYHRN